MIDSARYRRKDLALIQERSRALPESVRGAQPDWFLPLNDSAYQVLLSLSGPTLSHGSQAGLENAQPTMLPGTVRATLARLVEQGLAEEETASAQGPVTARDRGHRVTELGYAVLLAESGRRRRGRGAA